MAKRVSDKADDEAVVADDRIVVGDQSREVTQVQADPGDVVVVGGTGSQAAFDAQAQISGFGDDTIPQHVVESANRGRLARGEEPVVLDNVAPRQDLFAPKDSAFGEMDGVGEDTQAVKQSQVPRLRDGKRVSAEQVHKENQDL